MVIGSGAAFLLGQQMEQTDQPTTENALALDDLRNACEQVRQGAVAAQTWRNAFIQRDVGQIYRGFNITWPPTPGQHAERERIRQAAQDRDAQVERERAAARERANTLLVEKLTPEQRQTWTDKHYVEVRGSQTKRLYRIRDRGDGTYSMNIDCPESGYTYCAYPENAHEMPMADVVLAQMLWLTTDEPGFLRMANTSSYRGADSTRYQPGWIDERRQNTDININDYCNVWAQPRNDQGQYVVWDRAQEEDRGILDAMLARREPIRRPTVIRDGVEAWVPDCCVERGCELTINRTDDPRDLFPCITIDHVDAARAFHLVLPRSRDWDTRGIRRYLQDALHRA